MSEVAIAAYDPSAMGRVDRVSVERNAELSEDFARVLDAYRGRASQMDQLSERISSSPDEGGVANPQMRNLVQLYNHAVDTQLITRASGQLTSGLRQLTSGQ